MLHTTSPAESIFVARQPVFHPDQTVWGYELLFRSNMENVANFDDETQATSAVITDGLTMALEGLVPTPRILINFPEEMLISDAGFALPKNTCIIEILENVRPSKKTLKAIYRLKQAGYTIAVDDFFGQPKLEPFIKLADIVKIDILALDSDPARIAKVIAPIQQHEVRLLAEKVEDLKTFNTLKDMGFQLFQGYFFSKPIIVSGKKLSSNQMTKLQLLSELSGDFEPDKLAEILQLDPNLSYRLFRFINSVGFGLKSKITSLKRAIDMMGTLQTKQWLRTAILADVSSGPVANELAFMSVQRAKFLESLCKSQKSCSCPPETMFVVGLFSLLDTMLGLKMDSILDKLPLDDTIVNGLTLDGEIRELLSLAQSYEYGYWEETNRRLKILNLDNQETDILYAQARSWAQRMLGYSTDPQTPV